MSENEITKLIDKFKKGTLTEQESAFLNDWYLHYATEKESTFNPADLSYNLELLKTSIKDKLVNDVFNEDNAVIRNVSLWPRIVAAASVILIIGAGLFFLKNQNAIKQDVHLVSANVIKPGGNKAFLTLADGSRISIDDSMDGKLATQAGINITKTKDGKLIYTLSDNKLNEVTTGYNTIETPKGGQYQINLPDGTKVWLNAETKLKFPITFAHQKERKVELIGEAYFEVAKLNFKKSLVGEGKQERVPFIVSSKGQMIEVLGTHFNVNAYTNNLNTKTTLLEGSVRVSPTSNNKALNVSPKAVYLVPGQQASLEANNVSLKNVDVESAVAWKNGLFTFNGEPLNQVMNEISRWYNVDVEYKGDMSGIKIAGSVSKFAEINQILDVLALAGKIKIQTEGKKIIISR